MIMIQGHNLFAFEKRFIFFNTRFMVVLKDVQQTFEGSVKAPKRAYIFTVIR